METKYLLLVVALVVSMLIYWAVYVYRLRRFLRKAKVTDIIYSDEYKRRMGMMIKEMLNQRAKEQVAAGEKGGRLKGHPIEHLEDEGVLNPDDMAELYEHSIQKTLIGYSAAERDFIKYLGGQVYQMTVSDLLNRAFMGVKKKGRV